MALEEVINTTLGRFIDSIADTKGWSATPTIEIRCSPPDFRWIADALLSTQGRAYNDPGVEFDQGNRRRFTFIYDGISIVFRETQAVCL